MSKEWFEKFYPEKDPEFEAWWLKDYGPPEQYASSEDEQDEYWIRKGFALRGWKARMG
jgi:hypothetical protein